jgi:hypothetical protein
MRKNTEVNMHHEGNMALRIISILKSHIPSLPQNNLYLIPFTCARLGQKAEASSS